MEISPLPIPVHLSPIVEEVYLFRFNALLSADRQFQTIADGRSGLFIQLSTEGQFHFDSKPLPAAFIWGASSRHTSITINGSTEMLAIILKPMAVKAAFGIDAVDFTNTHHNLDLVFANFTEMLSHYPTLHQKLQYIYTFLSKNYERNRGSISANVVQALHLMEASCFSVPIKDLCFQMNVSERTLQRLFINQVGLSPKLFTRIQRFQKIMTLLRRQETLSPTHLPEGFDYSDQSHFIREFREFSGFTPTALPFRKNDLI